MWFGFRLPLHSLWTSLATFHWISERNLKRKMTDVTCPGILLLLHKDLLVPASKNHRIHVLRSVPRAVLWYIFLWFCGLVFGDGKRMENGDHLDGASAVEALMVVGHVAATAWSRARWWWESRCWEGKIDKFAGSKMEPPDVPTFGIPRPHFWGRGQSKIIFCGPENGDMWKPKMGPSGGPRFGPADLLNSCIICGESFTAWCRFLSLPQGFQRVLLELWRPRWSGTVLQPI